MVRVKAALLASLILVLAGMATAQPVGTAFTYQGRLTDGGGPANGTYDFRFLLYDDAVGGAQVGPIVTRDDVAVAGGLFTVSLDFGAVFAGNRRWLEVGVRPGASTGAYSVLSSRQDLAPAPNALFSSTAPWTGLTGVPAGFADGVDNNSGGDITGVTAGAGLTGGGATGAVTLAVDFAGTGTATTAARSDHTTAWTGLAGVPAGFADGVDNDSGDITGVTAGAGLTGGGTSGAVMLGVSFAGDGAATTVARSDHDHLGQTWTGTVAFGTGLNVINSGGFGIFGQTTATVGTFEGVRGQSASSVGRGVAGYTTGTTGTNYGVYGQSASSAGGAGVYGIATATGGSGSGVYGVTNARQGSGVFGQGSNLDDISYGVRGESAAGFSAGVFGKATGNQSSGVEGETTTSNGAGVLGLAGGVSGLNFGVYGSASSTAGYAGYFYGRAHVNGTLSKAAGSFKIDHPLDPQNKYLYHSFVESPDMMNVYNGNVTLDEQGEAEIVLPEWLEALNRDFRYQLTPIGGPGPNLHVANKIRGNRFRIAGGARNLEVSWQVTGIRKDAFAEAHRIPVEEDKPAEERGTYLHPVEQGAPQEMGRDHKLGPLGAERRRARASVPE